MFWKGTSIRCAIIILSGLIVALVIAAAAHAADYAPEEAPVLSWTGLYIGGAGGWAFDDQVEFRIREEPWFHDRHDLEGWVAGGQLGARYQFWTGPQAAAVAGIEVQGFATDINGGAEINILGSPYAPKLHTNTDVDGLIMAKGKLGIAVDRWWFFGTAGWASANLQPSASLNLGDIYVPVQACSRQCGGGSAKFSWEDDRRQSGVVFGAGINYAVTDNLIAGVEWNHIDMPDVSFSGPVKFQGYNLFPVHTNADFGLDIVMGTLSWNFP